MANRRSRRAWLLPITIGLHVGIGVAMYASGIWSIERLDSGRRFGEIGVMMPPPPPPGGGSPPAAARRVAEPKVRLKIATFVQPVTKAKQDQLKSLLSGTEEGRGVTGSGKGTGAGSGDGACVLPPCGDIGDTDTVKAPEVPKVPAISTLTPVEIAQRRISGETQVEPAADDKSEMRESGVAVVSGTFQITVSAQGTVTGVQIVKSTGYAGYDQRLVTAMSGWRYRPYSIDGTAQPFRGTIRFDFKLGVRK